MCYKSKTFILLRLENSGKYSVRNLCYDYFFIKEENGKVFETLKSLKYKTSPIPSGGLEVPLSLIFSCKEKWVVDLTEEFVQNFYTFEYNRNQSVNTNDSKDEEEDDYQTIVLEPENEENEDREKSQSEKIDLEINNDILFLL